MKPPLKAISSIELGLLSPEEIHKMSVVKVVTPDTYDEGGYPLDRGLMDRRLGVVDPGLRCMTCKEKPGRCPGHFGHIELTRPVLHIGFVEKIYEILRATCRACGRILLPQEVLDQAKEKIKETEDWWKISEKIMSKAWGVKDCPHCGEEQKEIRLEKPYTIWEENEHLKPSVIRERLERITDDDCWLLGLNPKTARPEWMVLTVLPVPPPTIRPSMVLETGIRSEDDLTHKLVDIIRINERLADNIRNGAPHLIIEDLWDLLQYHVATYFSNEISGVPPARHRSGRVLTTLTQRLKGKEGRFRGYLCGKRVDFSARAVISPDPNISINEVGVPEYVARDLTVPMRVTRYNIEEARTLVRRGPDIHPGAKWVITPDGRRFDLRFADREELAKELDEGWIVERHLRDGDLVLFNRQPSLHRMSIMAHRARVMPGKTFRLNLAVCPPYNADFDGDEMNLHVLQSEEARAEARILMQVQEHIVSPRFGGSIIGGVQEHITGCYLLTRRNTLLTKEQAQYLLFQAGISEELPPPAVKKDGVPYWTGKQIFSMLLPRGLNLVFKAKICENCSKCREEECPIDAYVVIKDGQLVSGVIDANAIKALDRCAIVDRIVKEWGTEKAREFLDKVTRLSIAAIRMFGFTTGLDDEEIAESSLRKIREVLEEKKREVQKWVECYRRGELEPAPGKTLEETLEMKIMEILAEARDKAGEIAEKELGGLGNHSVIMARTGARGSMLNLTQMAACVGQQSVRGERPKRGYYQRVLPHFKRGDLGAEARGFVTNSYRRGLTPAEFFFHAMGGREGLVDTAVRTSQSGYLQRRLINALQDLKVWDDGTVRGVRGRIVQFTYGEDGVDPMKSERGKSVDLDRIIFKVIGK